MSKPTTMRIITKIIAAIFFCYLPLCFASLPTVAFFYGSEPPLDQLRAYDVIVVSPDANVDPAKFNSPQSQLFAYVSVGEVDKNATYRDQIPSQWLLGTNTIWESKVIDQTQPEWQKFFLNNIITPLREKGYRGFFLDTLDSYMLYVHDQPGQQKQIDALVNLIRSIKTKYPDAQLILNRGFEFLPAIHDSVYAVAAESLFAGWNQAKREYQPISKNEREDLLAKLTAVQKMGIPVIVIDYVPPGQRQEAINIAQKISALGMIPWVTDGQLQTLGVGSILPIRRKIFVIYTPSKDSTIFDPAPFILTDLPLAYLGYTSEYHDGDGPLPENFSADDYAGILVWTNPSTDKKKQNLQAWLVKRLLQNIPIVFMSTFGFKPTTQSLAPFGIITPDSAGEAAKSVSITKKDPMVGFEIKAFSNRFEFSPARAARSRVLLQLKDQNGRIEDAIAITPWGGYALDPFVVIQMPDETNFWVIDPLAWLPLALRLPVIPAPDVTTENGRRLMLVHIDGDGFVSQAEWEGGGMASVELENHILKIFRIPTTVSVITGEIAPNGLYPKLSPKLVKIAQEIFALPWVEIASHTFSHPFDWILVAKYPKRYHLPIPNYVYDPYKEIIGSADYINQYLAPKGKTCKILLWSGNANPDEKVLALTYQAHLANLNGGDTYISNTKTSISGIGTYGRRLSHYIHVLSAMDNEEYYTNGWLGPFYGFERVTEAFKLTDSPHRFKPIDIYYHFYSATKIASLKALRIVYKWALSQPVMNIYASEYSVKVADFHKASIARVGDGWQVTTTGNLRELRVPPKMGYPDLNRSDNVVGYNQFNDSYYLHLGPNPKSTIYFTTKPPTLPYLVEANGRVTKFQRNKDSLLLHLQGYLPLQWTLGNMNKCTVTQAKKLLSGISKQGNVTFQLSSKDSDDLYITCQQQH